VFAGFDKDAIVVCTLGLEEQLGRESVNRDGARCHQPQRTIMFASTRAPMIGQKIMRWSRRDST
jgi:hypothetical protein